MIEKFSIGILSWKSRQTLENTLASYEKNGLLTLTNDITIIFQEVSNEDRDLANKYSLSYIGLEKNVGIGKAFMILAENAKNENIIFLEHDWELIENLHITSQRISSGISFLNAGYKAIRLRHRINPGVPLFSLPAYKGRELEHYDSNIDMISPHLIESIHWLEEPDKMFPDKIQKINGHFLTNSRWSNWTNNPCLYKRKFYIDTVKTFLNDQDKLLEPVISHWWARQDFRIAWGEGLFKHNDIGKYGAQ